MFRNNLITVFTVLTQLNAIPIGSRCFSGGMTVGNLPTTLIELTMHGDSCTTRKNRSVIEQTRNSTFEYYKTGLQYKECELYCESLKLTTRRVFHTHISWFEKNKMRRTFSIDDRSVSNEQEYMHIS